MNVNPNTLYHVFNQGNNKQVIFKDKYDYFHFLELFRKYIAPYCDVLAWCLMPNHFHFELNVNVEGAIMMKNGAIELSKIANGFRLLQSKYAMHFNYKYERSGNLFRQKIKAKACEDLGSFYRFRLFEYIHLNALESGLVHHPIDWPYSSYADYFGDRRGSLCNKKLAEELIGFGLTYNF